VKDYLTLSDSTLVRETRKGHENAYAVLWQRHANAALTVARSYTSFDADDVVAEAFTLVYNAIRQGGGPDAAFRPYLFTTLRNVAAGWGRADRAIATEDLDRLADQEAEQDTLDALDKSLTARAFTSLPTRWQEVLWYVDVESMAPRQVGPLLGMKPNAVSALAIRAREGLRLAWIKAHLASTATDPECARTIERLPGWSRGTLAPGVRRQVDDHLAGCSSCQIVADEASTVNQRLTLILLPLAAGVGAATAYLAAHQGAAASATALPSPVLLRPHGLSEPASRTGILVTTAATGAAVVLAGGMVFALTLGQTTVEPATDSTTVTAADQPSTGTELPLIAPIQLAPDPAPGPPPSTDDEPSPDGSETAPSDDTAPPEDTPQVTAVADTSVPAPASPSPQNPTPPVTDPTLTEPEPPTAPEAPSMVRADRPSTVYPALSGVALPGAEVTLLSLDGLQQWVVTAGADGAWAIELTDLQPGTTTVTATQTVATDAGSLTSPASSPVTVELAPAPTGQVDVVTEGVLYTISADGIPGQTFQFIIPSAGFTSSELTFDANGHWTPDNAVYLPGTDVLLYYVDGALAGPSNQAHVGP